MTARPLKVLLVRPRPDPETIGLQHVMLVEPLELEVLAATCGPGILPVVVDLALEDDGIDRFLREVRPDVLGVTGYITNVPEMLALCRAAKRFEPAIRTVAGGVHCEVVPGDLDDPAVDFRVVRNAISGFPKLLAHLRGDGPLPPGVWRPGDSDPSTLPPHDFAWVHPDRDTARRYRDRYFYIFHDRVALLKTAFGCPYSCRFCFCREITGRRYRERPLDDVLDELQALPEREIYIVDDDFLVSRDRVLRFCDGLRERGIDKHYLVYGRADFIARNPDVIQRFRDTGLRTVIVGFESFSDAELARYHKQADAASNAQAMAVIRRLGLDCYATVILSPDWGPDEFRAAGRKMRNLDIRFVNLQPLTPLPGTETVVPDSDLVISRKDFAKWDLAHVTVRPTRLSVADFYGELIDLYVATLYRPEVLWRHARQPVRMIAKMLAGTWRVAEQYRRKRAEAERIGCPGSC